MVTLQQDCKYILTFHSIQTWKEDLKKVKVRKWYCGIKRRGSLINDLSCEFPEGRNFFDVFVTFCCRFRAKFSLSIFLFSRWCYYINYCSIYFAVCGKKLVEYWISNKTCHDCFCWSIFWQMAKPKETAVFAKKERQFLAKCFISVSISPY